MKRLAREEPISGAVYSCAAAHGYVYECLVTWTANAVPMRAAWGPFDESVGYAELDLDEDPARIVQRLRETWHSRRAGKSWDPTRGRLGTLAAVADNGAAALTLQRPLLDAAEYDELDRFWQRLWGEPVK
ncbi:MAG: hypothetical protein M5U28_21880 [Sandaracinaceae bacterium]|nr:hypothetical protein [Sandaracinaceae bacterium]